MTLTIFKNDDFESVGFKITNNGEYVYHHGIQSGWSKDVPMNRENIELTQRIMCLEAKLSILRDAMSDWFKIAEQNNIKHGGINFSRIDDKIDNVKRAIDYALAQLH